MGVRDRVTTKELEAEVRARLQNPTQDQVTARLTKLITKEWLKTFNLLLSKKHTIEYVADLIHNKTVIKIYCPKEWRNNTSGYVLPEDVINRVAAIERYFDVKIEFKEVLNDKGKVEAFKIKVKLNGSSPPPA